MNPTIRQVLATSSLGLCLAGIMSSWTFPAVALPQMDHPNSTINFTPDQASWFASVTLMMCIPGSVVGASICEAVGPRRLYLLLTPFMWISFSSMTIASWNITQEAGIAESLLIVLRVIQGILVAVLVSASPVYLYEISDHRLRGIMTSTGEVWSSYGFLLCSVSGCFLSWYEAAWVLPLFTLFPGFLGLLYAREAPLWLARKGRISEAKAVLSLFRCTPEEVTEDLTVASNSLKEKKSVSESLRMLAKKSNALAVATSCATMTLKELTGFVVLFVYLVHIFDAAGIGLDPSYSSVIVGFVRLICNSIASFLLHNIRRKILLVSGNIISGIGAGVLGAFFYSQSLGYNLTWLSWLPLAGMVTLMIGGATAVAPTTWVITVEVLPGAVRFIGWGLSVTCYSITAFIISKTFITLQTYIGMHGIFWFFGGATLAFSFFTIFVLPETYGKSIRDIEEYWNSNEEEKIRPVPKNVVFTLNAWQ